MTALTKNIKVSPEFKSWLDKQGRRGETMEQVLKRLLRWGETK